MHFLSLLFQTDVVQLVKTVGYIGMFVIATLESGVIIGLFLPGDSMLFISGLMASYGHFNIFILITLYAIAAVLGNTLGYWFGEKVGVALFTSDARFFKKKHLDRTHEFYEKYGQRAIVLARFVPVIRTLAPIVAGAARMNYGSFMLYNVIGAILWGIGMPTVGFILGDIFPGSDKYVVLLAFVVVGLSVLPTLIEIWRSQRRRSAIIK